MTPFIEKVQQAKRFRFLKKLAHEEYESARGTAHLYLLRTAEQNLRKKLKQVCRTKEIIEPEISTLGRKESQELRICLERYLVTYRLGEVPGIGLNLRQAIVNTVFRGSIRDLYEASSLVQGIGASKQQMINAWVSNYFSKLSTLINEPFPGKETVVEKWAGIRKEKQIAYKLLEDKQKEYESTIKQVNEIISQLQVICEQDFLKALLDPKSSNLRIEYYQRGVFAEWEPIPDWFMKILVESDLENA